MKSHKYRSVRLNEYTLLKGKPYNVIIRIEWFVVPVTEIFRRVKKYYKYQLTTTVFMVIL